MKILITSGATREPIDEVRYITNFSTGSTGAYLADFFGGQGHGVTLLAGSGATTPRYARQVTTYTSFEDLNEKLRQLLAQSRFDGIIHLAAISDFSVDSVETGSKIYSPRELKKLDSVDEVTLKLKRNFKIVSNLKKYALPSVPVVVAFKLTNSPSYEEQMKAIVKLGGDPGVDFVVHNDFQDIKDGKDNRYRVFKKEKIVFESLDKHSLAVELEQLIGGHS